MMGPELHQCQSPPSLPHSVSWWKGKDNGSICRWLCDLQNIFHTHYLIGASHPLCGVHCVAIRIDLFYLREVSNLPKGFQLRSDKVGI